MSNPNTAVFPRAVATDSDLLVAANNASSPLTAGIDASTLTIPVTNGALYNVPCVVTIDNEVIKIASKASNTLTAAVGGRGFSGTTATSHLINAPVAAQIDQYYTNQLAAEVKAIEGQLGTNLTGVQYLNTRFDFTPITVLSALTAATPATVTLSPFPVGIVSDYAGLHSLRITDGVAGNETVLLTAINTGAGTVTFTPTLSHVSGNWTIKSATAGIQELVGALPANGGTGYIGTGIFTTLATINLGNGSRSTGNPATGSTRTGIRLVGAGTGYMPYDSTVATAIQWGGASGGGPMFRINGPIGACSLSQMQVHCMNLANLGVEIWGNVGGDFTNIQIQRPIAGGVGIALYATDNFSGSSTGMTFKNMNINALENGCVAMKIGDQLPTVSWVTNAGNFGNVFINCTFTYKGDVSTSYGIYLKYADNNTFIGGSSDRVQVVSPAGFAVFLDKCAAPYALFPSENRFSGTSLHGGVGGISGTGGTFFCPYQVADSGAIAVTGGNVWGWTETGKSIGQWTFRDDVTIDEAGASAQLLMKGWSGLSGAVLSVLLDTQDVYLRTLGLFSLRFRTNDLDRLIIDQYGNQRIFPTDVGHIPSSNPASGFYMYVDPADNKLKVRGASGTITVLALP